MLLAADDNSICLKVQTAAQLRGFPHAAYVGAKLDPALRKDWTQRIRRREDNIHATHGLFGMVDAANGYQAIAPAVRDAEFSGDRIDQALLTDNCNSYFTEQALKDFGDSLGPLGTPTEFTQESKSERGGMTFRLFEVHFPKKTLQVWERIMPDGKIEQYQVAAK